MYENLEPIAVQSRGRTAVATASRSPAEEEAPPPSGRNCMPPSPLPPARTLSNWRLANRVWR